jgi:hypothetical protein
MREHEKARLMRAPSIGPRMVAHLESIGIERLEDLAGADPEDLAFRVNAELGRRHIHATGVRALANAVALADREAKDGG